MNGEELEFHEVEALLRDIVKEKDDASFIARVDATETEHPEFLNFKYWSESIANEIARRTLRTLNSIERRMSADMEFLRKRV